MHSVPKRVEKSSKTGRNNIASPESFQVNKVARWHNYVFGEGAVLVHAFHADVLADVTLARRTLLAVTAKDMHFSGDIVAHASNAGVDVFANLYYFATKLVADNDGLIPRDVSSIVTQHFISHAGLGGDLVD